MTVRQKHQDTRDAAFQMVIDFNETHEDVLVHMNYGIKGAGLEKEVDFFEKIEMS